MAKECYFHKYLYAAHKCSKQRKPIKYSNVTRLFERLTVRDQAHAHSYFFEQRLVISTRFLSIFSRCPGSRTSKILVA